MIAAILQFLGAPAPQHPEWRRLNAQFHRSQSLIRAFYAFALFLTLYDLDSWSAYLSRASIDPLWPVFWLGSGSPDDASIYAILAANLIASIAVVICPEWRGIRIFYFIAFLEYVAFRNSFGKINHWGHLILLISFVLIFLPSGWSYLKASWRTKAQTTLNLYACLGIILLTYSMSGLGKLIVGAMQAFQGQPHSLSFDALARHIADRMLETGQDSYFGDFIIDHAIIGWPLMLGAIYIQLSSIFVLFRPSLHRLWGIAHLGFHIGVYFTMTISFNNSTFLLALLLIATPFHPDKCHWKDMIKDLPLFGKCINPLVTAKKAD